MIQTTSDRDEAEGYVEELAVPRGFVRDELDGGRWWNRGRVSITVDPGPNPGVMYFDVWLDAGEDSSKQFQTFWLPDALWLADVLDAVTKLAALR